MDCGVFYLFGVLVGFIVAKRTSFHPRFFRLLGLARHWRTQALKTRLECVDAEFERRKWQSTAMYMSRVVKEHERHIEHLTVELAKAKLPNGV